MRHEAALRTSLLALAVLMVAVGIWTCSLKKMLATYAFGISGIAVILLPDWEFFDRDFYKWFTPIPAHRAPAANWAADNFRLKFFPLRLALITLIYGFGLYKWWRFQLS
ncbi:signal peptidase complex-like protein DTM1 [Curcuma longa]|uniref:signal peptidase complex-like protein DTM1 n=1 Tax=Curcuma longa TaxID=136217 RepID=UPI003D9EFDE0